MNAAEEAAREASIVGMRKGAAEEAVEEEEEASGATDDDADSTGGGTTSKPRSASLKPSSLAKGSSKLSSRGRDIAGREARRPAGNTTQRKQSKKKNNF